MRIKNLLPFAIALALLVSAVWVIAQEGEEKSAEQKEMMELMMKYGTPGEYHKLLDSAVGDWDIATKWYAAPGAPAEESKATAHIEWILGGRFIMEKSEGMMDEMPFNGIGILGYDNYGQKYNYLWIDNMSTMFFLQSGTSNKDGTLFTYEGTYDDFFTGQKGKVSRMIVKVIDKDKRISEMYDTTADGEEYMSMELTYTRKK